MYKKQCLNCETISYSASILNEVWLCPNCQQDITNIEPINILEKKEGD